MVGHKYTSEEHEFLHNYIPGHTYVEIVEAYNKRFEDQITTSRVKAYMANHKINNGLTGRFRKGHIPVNKGQKGVCAPGCEKSWFKPGHIPKNHRPVGSERVTRDGYVEVKVAEPNKWRLKHIIVYEEVHGKIPKGCTVFFLDGNKQNTAITNLKLITRAELLIINRYGLATDEPDLNDTVTNIAKLMQNTYDAKRKKSKQGECK